MTTSYNVKFVKSKECPHDQESSIRNGSFVIGDEYVALKYNEEAAYFPKAEDDHYIPFVKTDESSVTVEKLMMSKIVCSINESEASKEVDGEYTFKIDPWLNPLKVSASNPWTDGVAAYKGTTDYATAPSANVISELISVTYI